jgi:hypothetical protein
MTKYAKSKFYEKSMIVLVFRIFEEHPFTTLGTPVFHGA